MTRALRAPVQTTEMLATWLAACVSLTLAAVALEPAGAARIFAAGAGVLIALVAAQAYVRRATPVLAVLLTIAAAAISTATVMRVSGISLASGLSCSQAGGIEGPSAWLFRASSWCLAVGLLASGRLIARNAHASGYYGARGRAVASLLALISFVGFVIVGASRISSDRDLLYVIHNYAAVAAMGAFWVAMLGSIALSALPRSLRLYSAAAPLAIIVAWFPTALKFLRVTQSSPISTLDMELLVFALSFGWLAWMAHQSNAPGGSRGLEVADSSA